MKSKKFFNFGLFVFFLTSSPIYAADMVLPVNEVDKCRQLVAISDVTSSTSAEVLLKEMGIVDANGVLKKDDRDKPSIVVLNYVHGQSFANTGPLKISPEVIGDAKYVVATGTGKIGMVLRHIDYTEVIIVSKQGEILKKLSLDNNFNVSGLTEIAGNIFIYGHRVGRATIFKLDNQLHFVKEITVNSLKSFSDISKIVSTDNGQYYVLTRDASTQTLDDAHVTVHKLNRMDGEVASIKLKALIADIALFGDKLGLASIDFSGQHQLATLTMLNANLKRQWQVPLANAQIGLAEISLGYVSDSEIGAVVGNPLYGQLFRFNLSGNTTKSVEYIMANVPHLKMTYRLLGDKKSPGVLVQQAGSIDAGNGHKISCPRVSINEIAAKK